MNGDSTLLLRLIHRVVDLICDSLVVTLLLISVRVGVLPAPMSVAVIGYAVRSLVHPSLSLGVFNRNGLNN